MDCVVRAWVRALPVRLRVRTRIMVPNCMHTARQRAAARPPPPRRVVSDVIARFNRPRRAPNPRIWNYEFAPAPSPADGASDAPVRGASRRPRM